jgi:hypothetical protein
MELKAEIKELKTEIAGLTQQMTNEKDNSIKLWIMEQITENKKKITSKENQLLEKEKVITAKEQQKGATTSSSSLGTYCLNSMSF